MNAPRKHHYVPRSYLANFTDSAGRLRVLDRDSGRQWESSPEKTACQRDFYALEVTADDEHDALGVESFFAQVEGHAREAIQATLRGGCVPDGKLRKHLMEFLAVQAVRVPGALRGLDDIADQLGKRVAWYLTETPEAWAAHVRRMREAGDLVPDVPYEQLREFVLSEEYDVSWDQNTRLGMILRLLPQLAAVLSERKWTLVVAGDGCPDFVCSDRPLTVGWNDPPATRCMPHSHLVGSLRYLERYFRNDEDPRFLEWQLKRLRAVQLEAERSGYGETASLVACIGYRDGRPEVRQMAATFASMRSYSGSGDEGAGRLRVVRELLALYP